MNVASLNYREGFTASKDGVKLYYRDYGDLDSAATPVLCLSGLTRNTNDFHDVAQRLSRHRRVIVMDYRGRGRSGYDPEPNNYNPIMYATDAVTLLDHLNIPKVVVLGTSLGGICAMILAATAPQRTAAIVLNDIGPQIDENGRQRIASYVGKDIRFKTLEEAAAALMAQYHSAYPDKGIDHWLKHAANTFVRDNLSGDWKLDYDLNLAKPIIEQAKTPAPDLWPLFAALKAIPTLAVRGALSDVLDVKTFARMATEKPDLKQLIVPNRGHVPLPHEEPFVSALENFLKSF